MKRSNKNKLKVLILEDVVSDAELVKLQFEQLDYQCSFVITYKENEYIDLLKSFDPDMVTSDFNMPNFDGLKALKILRAKDPVTPFLFVTGSLGEENAVKAIKTGATDFINKNRIDQLPPAVLRALRELDEVHSKYDYMRQVERNEQRFRALVQSGSDFIAIVNEQGGFIFISENYITLLGYTEEDLVGQSLFSFVHPEDLNQLMEAFKVIRGKEVVILDPYRFKNAFGQWHWFQCTITNKLDEESVSGVVLNSQDITSLTHKEQELLVSNERYRLASAATQDIIYDWDLIENTVMRDASIVEKMLGYGSKISNRDSFWSEIIHPDDQAGTMALLSQQFEDIKSYQCEHTYRVKHANGQYLYIQDNGHIVRDKDGKAIRLIGASRDITSQVSREKLKDLLLSVSSIMSEPKSLKHSMGKVLRLIADHSGNSFSEFWYYPENTRSELKVVTHYADQVDEREFLSTEYLTKLSQGGGLVGEVLQHQSIVHFNKSSQEHQFIRRKEASKLKVGHVVGVPVVLGNICMGVLLLFQKKNGSFTITDDDLMNLSLHLAPDLKRKIAEEELNNFFNLSAELLCIMSLDGHLKKINEAFSGVLDFPKEELLTRKIYELAHPDDREEVIQKIQEVREGKEVLYFESRYLTRNEKTRWLRWSITVLKDEGILLGAGHNITERKGLEKLVEQTHEVARMGSWELDLTDNSLFWTSLTRIIHEVDHDYAPEMKTAIDFYKEGESRETILRCVEDGIQKGIPWDEELQIVTAKGNLKWVRAIGEAELLEGKCVRLYGSFQDITDKKIKEEELKASKVRFELAARATKETIYEWDCKSDQIHWSDGLEKTFGYAERQTSFQKWIDRIHPLDRNQMTESMKRLKENSKEEFWLGTYRFFNAAGEVVLVEDRRYVERDRKGNSIRMIGSVNDITEERNFQQRLLESAIQSEEKERNRLAMELHDGIVQELVGCGMKAEYLCIKLEDRNANFKEELVELRDTIKKITTNTRNVSHNLLSADFMNMSLVDLLDHLNQNLNQVGDIDFKVDCCLYEDIGNVQIKVNLYRTIQELCNNAIKHSGARNMKIKIYKEGDGELHVVAVDDGKGLDMNKKKKGIGLINIRQRIESIGGGIEFRNKEGAGLEVSIMVPLRKVMKETAS